MESRIEAVLTSAYTAQTVREMLEAGVGTSVVVKIEDNLGTSDFTFMVHRVTDDMAFGCTSEGHVVVISLGDPSEAEVKRPTIVVSDAASC